MTPAGIEPATFRFVAQRLNHCATEVPELYLYRLSLLELFPLSQRQQTLFRKIRFFFRK